MENSKIIMILTICGVALTFLGIFGFKIFDITIFKWPNLQVDPVEKPEPEVSLQIDTEEELEPQNLPQVSAEKEPDQETSSQQIEVGKLPVPKLIEILKDLSSSSYRLSFIKDNISFMPDVLSLKELNDILILFSSNSYRSNIKYKFRSLSC